MICSNNMLKPCKNSNRILPLTPLQLTTLFSTDKDVMATNRGIWGFLLQARHPGGVWCKQTRPLDKHMTTPPKRPEEMVILGHNQTHGTKKMPGTARNLSKLLVNSRIWKSIWKSMVSEVWDWSRNTSRSAVRVNWWPYTHFSSKRHEAF